MPPTPLGQFRLVGLIEGCSYMLLVCVGMPLKYLAKIPQPNYVIGATHGALVVLFCVCLLRAAISRRWPLSRTALAFVASLLPFGTFLMDGTLRREMAEEASEGKSEQDTP